MPRQIGRPITRACSLWLYLVSSAIGSTQPRVHININSRDSPRLSWINTRKQLFTSLLLMQQQSTPTKVCQP